MTSTREVSPTDVLIVGASVAGTRTAQALRRAGFSGSVRLVGAERHHPYDKPPLSKGMLLPDGDPVPVPLLSADELAALDVDLLLGTRAVALDTEARSVRTESGELLRFSQLVIATGVTPRTLPGTGGIRGVHTLRDADDAIALRAALAHARQVVVVGAGFIGAEFAAAARQYGAQVTVVEVQPVPMAHLFGTEVGSALAGLHARAGVDLVTGAHVMRLDAGPTGAVSAVVLTDGRVLDADLVVVGIGARPAVEWLESSGLPLPDGVLCDADLRVRGGIRDLRGR
ncbi:NAD(P)/FAD-dependent oxidoreductase [Streptomyces sp. NPDC002143]